MRGGNAASEISRPGPEWRYHGGPRPYPLGQSAPSWSMARNRHIAVPHWPFVNIMLHKGGLV